MAPPGSPPRARRPAVFLDRDGTILREFDYLADPDGVELIAGAAEAIRALSEAGFAVVCVTNQSGVARGLLDLGTLARIHERMGALLAEHGARLDAIESCPHHPDHDGVDSPRRKPRPGMLLDAARALDLDPVRSWTVGDAERDVRAGELAGGRGILVATGKGEREFARAAAAGSPPRAYARDLAEAARRILATQGK